MSGHGVIPISGGWRVSWQRERTARDAFGLGAASGSTIRHRATTASRVCDRIAVTRSAGNGKGQDHELQSHYNRVAAG
jgi:hypothetical protein